MQHAAKLSLVTEDLRAGARRDGHSGARRNLDQERGEVDAAAANSAEAPPDRPSSPLPDDVVTALGELSPEHRAVVVLRFVCDYTPGEIARALDMPRGTVNSRLRRALDRLGEVIER